jgi:hypothetical protein
MKSILAIGLLFISTLSIASAQESGELLRSPLTQSQRKEAEQRLSNLGYWTGTVDGVFDLATRSALTAFQKWERRPTTARLTLDELEAIRSSSSPKARESGYGHVEVDIERQVLLIISDEGVVRILPVSTGSDKTFMDEGKESVAYTPRGRFLVYDKGVGWEKDPPQSMYFSNYISGGVAIHGNPSVPNRPASHGCIRIPMFAAREVSKLLPVGTIVLVYDNVTFVSAKPWIENPKLKEAALLISTIPDYEVSSR